MREGSYAVPVRVDLQTEAIRSLGIAPDRAMAAHLRPHVGDDSWDVVGKLVLRSPARTRPSSRTEIAVERTGYEQPGAASPIATHPNA